MVRGPSIVHGQSRQVINLNSNGTSGSGFSGSGNIFTNDSLKNQTVIKVT
jgi:hypothetical protein